MTSGFSLQKARNLQVLSACTVKGSQNMFNTCRCFYFAVPDMKMHLVRRITLTSLKVSSPKHRLQTSSLRDRLRSQHFTLTKRCSAAQRLEHRTRRIGGGYVRTDIVREVIAAWLNASRRSRVGVGMNRSARVWSVKGFELEQRRMNSRLLQLRII